MRYTPEIRHLDFPYNYAQQLTATLESERQDIQRRQFNSSLMQSRQLQLLQRLLRHASESCPYYTPIFVKAGILPRHMTGLADLSYIPLLSRQAVRNYFYDLCSDRFNLEHCYVKSTSGSTGEPIKIVLDYSINMYLDILLLNFIQPYGIMLDHFQPLCTGIIFITSFPTSTSFTYFPPQLNFSRFYKLSIHPDRWKSPQTTLQFISDLHPLIITGMPEHLLLLQQMMQTEDPIGQYPIRPRLLLASGNKLYPKAKEKLEAHFQVPVVDIYALTEFGYLAVACASGSGYHVDDSLILEIARPDGTLAPPGETGEIVVTSLRNFVMPLIRYRTGDFGCLSPLPCPCGSQWPLLAAIQGRTNEFFTRIDGTLLNPFVFLRHLDRLPLVQYQVTQLSLSEVMVKYIPLAKSTGLESRILEAIYAELGSTVKVHVELVTRIGEPGHKIQNFVSLTPNPFWI
jgi:phenylacetate-CoA ligase